MNRTFTFNFIVVTLLLAANSAFGQAGPVATVAGGGTSAAEGVPATSALMGETTGVGVDGDGNLYIADWSLYKIRKVNHTTGLITTVAGNGVCAYAGDGGPATAASICNSMEIYVDWYGNIFIADAGNALVRRVDAATGIITTVAGGGTNTGSGGPATALSISPIGVFADPAGNIYVGGNNRIYKIDGLTGIATTVVGNGIAADGGDGGPATSATITLTARSITMDKAGNLYFVSDIGFNVRKVNAVTGIVSLISAGALDIHGIASDGAGNVFIADWYSNHVKRFDTLTHTLDTIESVPHPYCICTDPANGKVYYSDHLGKVWMFSYSPLPGFVIPMVGDSFSVASVDKQCSGPELTVVTPYSVIGRSVKTDFGDGTTDSGTFVSGLFYGGKTIIRHAYANAGTYTIRQKLYHGATIVDSLSFLYVYTYCKTFSLKFFHDANTNCIKDSGESFSTIPVEMEVDSSGIPVDTVSVTSGIYYDAYSPPGTIYRFSVLYTPGGLFATCPSSGYILDTVSALVTSYADKYFGLTCPTSPVFDLALHAVTARTGANRQLGNIYVWNTMCYPAAGSVMLSFSPRYGNTLSTIPTPSSVSGNTMTWNLSSLTAYDPAPFRIYYYLRSYTILHTGDTVQQHVVITPIAGDANPLNNSEIIIDTVRAGDDPNEMSVTPARCIPSDVNPVQLQYTINFENTGNDTAHNIYVMDTLADDLDPRTFRIVTASAVMNVELRKAAGHNIIWFSFPDINLLDSSHHDACDGTVIFTISTWGGIGTGANILNRAGIYFDYNDVVMTNTAGVTVGCPDISRVNQTAVIQPVQLYPNPATNELTIKTEKGAYTSFTITNTMGQTLLQQTISNPQTKVDVRMLPAGVYYIVLRGDNGNVVRKFVKM